VAQEEFASVPEVAVEYDDRGLPEVREPQQKLLPHVVGVDAGDAVLFGRPTVLVGEVVPLAHELVGEERVDERYVVVALADFEHPVPARRTIHVGERLVDRRISIDVEHVPRLLG